MNKQIIPAFVIALALGAGGGYWYARHVSIPDNRAGTGTADKSPLFYRNPMNPAITSPVPAKDEMGMDYIAVYAEEPVPKAEREVLFYRNPMNPAITSPLPAKDEMGMDYIPVYGDDDAGAGDEPSGTVRIDPVTVQNIGVRTATAEQRTLTRNIRTVGRVAYDEERLTRLHPKIEGWIENLFIDETGAPVKRDTVLLNIYSPQLVATQQEYLLALESRETLAHSPFEDIRRGAERMAKTTRERLRLLDVPEHQIRELEESREIKKSLHIHSPFDGVVINIGAREGQYVTPATELYMLADLSKVWVYANVYEYELPWVRVGDEVELQLSGVPGRTFTGQLIYVYPYAEPETRTVKVRIEFDNPDGLLKPDMFANVTIRAQRQVDAVTIPAEAVVRSGEREQVFVVRGAGKFEPREVRLGLGSDGLVQVLEGIEPGETVVTSSQFLIDSESKLREATAKMLEAMRPAEPATADQADVGGSLKPAAGDMDMEHGVADMGTGTASMKCGGMQRDDAAAGTKCGTDAGRGDTGMKCGGTSADHGGKDTRVGSAQTDNPFADDRAAGAHRHD